MSVHHRSSVAEKLALYASLFRGRNEVYARRFVSRKTGTAGYSPVCGNEWVRGVCEKPRMKCSNCGHQNWLPVTDEVLQAHLVGKEPRSQNGKDFVMGLYPMLRSERCYFLAVDFDGEGWEEESVAFLKESKRLGVPAALERSRSGNGGHVWVFFTEAIPAYLARALGSLILTRATARRPQVKLRSYDRFFPNQDTLPKGGFGNLIALPLQGQARAEGNSVFVDEELRPHTDQWAFLSCLQKMSQAEVERIVDTARRRGDLVGVQRVSSDEQEEWRPQVTRAVCGKGEGESANLAQKVRITLSDQVLLPKEALPTTVQDALIRLAAFQNPEFYKAQSMRLPTYDKPRIISCAEEDESHLMLPRGCLEEAKRVLRQAGVKYRVSDQREEGEVLSYAFQGELRVGQQEAARKLLLHDIGVLSATTAFGKTVLAAYMIAKRGVSTLILVHRKQLMDQWVVRLAEFLDITESEIGRLGGGRRKLKGKVDIALMQSMVKKGEVREEVKQYGHLIIDECHHISAYSFEQVARRAKAKYVLGLSATVARKDGHHPIIFMQCGPVRHTVSAKSEARKREFRHEVIVRPTGFRVIMEPEEDARLAYQQLCEALYKDDARNAFIAKEVVAAVLAGRSPLILTERTEHIEILHLLLKDEVENIIILRGGMGTKKMQDGLARLEEKPSEEDTARTSRLVLATGKFVGEGFDDPRLDTLFLTMPVSWKGTVAQYAGRLHRNYRGKEVVQIYDYADLNIPMLGRMFDKRCQSYEDVGYTILLPAHALPGWPQEIALPLDPQWKADYTASVQRLIRDGVDVPLARLFLNVTESITNKEGVERARSSSEVFLYQRLQSLADTKDAFQLNQLLQIPFNQESQMEVDFLCEGKKLVIELDGDQHLSDKAAYRRDRRKDVLLQENGYLVLRFLATDLALRLDEVLDTVMRVMARREGY